MNRGDERVFWIALNSCVCESPRDVRRLLAAFPAVGDIFRAPPRDLSELGVREDVLRRIGARETLETAKKELEKLDKKAYTLLTLRDDGYPPLLKETYDPPLVLTCSGRSEVLIEPAVAIVGSRKPTAYGRGRGGEDRGGTGFPGRRRRQRDSPAASTLAPIGGP